jgi:hypothetical protein
VEVDAWLTNRFMTHPGQRELGLSADPLNALTFNPPDVISEGLALVPVLFPLNAKMANLQVTSPQAVLSGRTALTNVSASVNHVYESVSLW